MYHWHCCSGKYVAPTFVAIVVGVVMGCVAELVVGRHCEDELVLVLFAPPLPGQRVNPTVAITPPRGFTLLKMVVPAENVAIRVREKETTVWPSNVAAVDA